MEKSKLCECGCGEIVKLDNRFIHGHNTNLRSPELIRSLANRRRADPYKLPRETRFCECGCGEEFECKVKSKQKFIRGHNLRVDNPVYRDGVVDKIVSSRKNGGYIISDKTRQKLSEANSGKNNPFYGRNHTEETKETLRGIRTGVSWGNHTEEFKRRLSRERSGENSPFYGKIYTPEEREIISKRVVGENNPNWRGGISFDPYPIEFNKKFKKKILGRDNQTCQVCGCPANVVHHINYSKNDCSEKNCIGMCRSCHSKTNFTREYWQLKLSLIQALRGVN